MNREVLHIGVSENGGSRMLRLAGELDSYTTSRLSWITATWVGGAKKVIVNLDELEYIDSSGLSALVRIWMKASESGTQLVLSCGNPRIYRILEITGLLNLFKVVSIGGEPAMAAGLGYTQPGIMRE